MPRISKAVCHCWRKNEDFFITYTSNQNSNRRKHMIIKTKFDLVGEEVYSVIWAVKETDDKDFTCPTCSQFIYKQPVWGHVIKHAKVITLSGTIYKDSSYLNQYDLKVVGHKEENYFNVDEENIFKTEEEAKARLEILNRQEEERSYTTKSGIEFVKGPEPEIDEEP